MVPPTGKPVGFPAENFMTREEAIKIFNTVLVFGNYDCQEEEAEKCFEMAIEALEQEPCEDCISRKAVLETIDNRIEQIKRDANEINKSYSHLSFAEGVHDGYCRLKCDMRILSSAKPQEQKIGHWIYTGDYLTEGMLKCSECGFEHDVSERFLYCPNCGAMMESEG